MVCIKNHLPEDLVANILCRLPAKDVLRFRCVSKSWKVLIDSQYFIRMHYNVSVRNNYKFFFSKKHCRLYTFRFNDSEKIEIRRQPLEPFPKNSKVLCFCNGLFLLEISNTKCAIWNPSTREYKELPESQISGHFVSRRTYRFCFDSVRDDYKVILIYQTYNTSDRSVLSTTFGIYSLKSDFWLQFEQDVGWKFHIRSANVFIDGALHWLGCIPKPESKNKWEIYSFDITTGELRVVPKFDYPSNIKMVYYGELEGCLSICTWGDNSADLWLMKDYGVKESWVKLFSVSTKIVIDPLAYSKSGTSIFYLKDKSRICLNDFTNRTITSNYRDTSVKEYTRCSLLNLVRLSVFGHGQEE